MLFQQRQYMPPYPSATMVRYMCICAFRWDTQASTLSLDQSITSLQFNSSPDLLEHYQLTPLSPTELHVAAIYGKG